MCGICGIIEWRNGKAGERADIERMCGQMIHRGPDREGVWLSGPVGLGHRRLSIIDLSDSAAQPMLNEDGSVILTFNGEIYNFQSLRKDLLERGHRFRSNSDSEVIIHLYEEKGVDCLQDLRGMFAFAIWDKRRQRLFLARDRVGKKPLKYFHDGKRFIFASELKSILALPDIPREEDRRAIHYYLAYGYCPAPMTGFQGIHKLPPAHYALVENGKLSIERYWQLSYRRKSDLSEAEWREALLERLEECVRLRLISDVPLGVFLSGGIDSSAITALMAKVSSTRAKTFSIGFSNDRFNELPYARQIAERYDTEHHEFVVEPMNVDIVPKLVHFYEEPYADYSGLPSYFLAKMARENVTVALNGDGGDENFAGYNRYVRFGDRKWLSKYLAPLGGSRIANWIANSSWAPTRLRQKAIPARWLLQSKPHRQFITLVTMFDPFEFGNLYSPDYGEALHDIDITDQYEEWFNHPDAGTNDIERAQFADVNCYLPGDLLPKVDIASMAHSLECRSPLLDHTFMELAATVPLNLKIRNGSTKYIFKETVRDLLPPELMQRPKQGFGIPVHDWFSGALKEMAREYLLSERSLARGCFRPDYLEHLFTLHEQGLYQGHPFWLLICLEEWRRQFIDRSP